MYSFGSGVLIGTRNDTPSTPVNFGLVQDVTMDTSFKLEELYGQQQFPLAIARGSGKITGKAKVARISGSAFSSLFFGVALTSGQTLEAYGEAGAIPGTPYAITVANSATWVDDLGVLNALTGLPYTKVFSGTPTTGQYKVAAGAYTFAAADTLLNVLISYTYTTTGGQKFTVGNSLLGTTPTFQANFYTTFQGLAMTIKYPLCVSTKLGFATKLEGFVIPEFDFSVQQDAAGNVAYYSFGDVG